jgi:threonine synthase
MMGIACVRCGSAYPEKGLPYCCPICQGLFDLDLLPFDPARVEAGQPGMWRYRHTFGLDARVEPVTLGEGNTPLVWAQVASRQVAFKCEFLNPSGSFKDRGSSLITTWLRQRGIPQAVEDSSGNAGASLAAYAARAGIRVRIYIPQAAAGPKRRQIEAMGGELVPIPGSRTQVTQAVRREVDRGQVYASHAYLPFNLPGYATAAYEIHDQLGGRLPGL